VPAHLRDVDLQLPNLSRNPPILFYPSLYFIKYIRFSSVTSDCIPKYPMTIRITPDAKSSYRRNVVWVVASRLGA
jgi:hypothetical protein